MPRYPYDEDIFKDSTMTFGEHLEELRRCLFRALVGLMVGFLAGLALGRQVVEFIQTPLRSALEGYYQQKALQDSQRRWEEFQKQGLPLPTDLELVKKLVLEEYLLPEEVYVDRQELVRAVGDGWPEAKQMLEKIVQEDADRAESASGGGPSKEVGLGLSGTDGAGVVPTSPLQKPGDSKGLFSSPASPTDAKSRTEAPSPDKQNSASARENLVRLFLWRRVAEDPRVQIKSFNVQEGFLIYVKASLLTGAILASPWIFYQLWIFIAAGLYPHEKRYVHVFLPISVLLFLAGVALAFFFVFPPVLGFLFSFNGWLGIDPDPRISEWLSFVLFLPLGFGIAFQLPLAMLFLERIGVFTLESYVSSWRMSVLVIFVISMIFTPADPYSMFLMAIPLLFLYVLGILMCKYMPRRWNPFD